MDGCHLTANILDILSTSSCLSTNLKQLSLAQITIIPEPVVVVPTVDNPQQQEQFQQQYGNDFGSETIQISTLLNKSMIKMSQSPILSNLTHFEISINHQSSAKLTPHTIQTLLTSPMMSDDLESLTLFWCEGLTDDVMVAVCECPRNGHHNNSPHLPLKKYSNLQELKISNTQVGNAGGHGFESIVRNLHNLTFLQCSYLPITDDAFLSIFHPNPPLDDLFVGGLGNDDGLDMNDGDDNHDTTSTSTSSHPQQQQRQQPTRWTQSDPLHPTHLLPNLTDLRISNSLITQIGCEALARSQLMDQLENLVIGHMDETQNPPSSQHFYTTPLVSNLRRLLTGSMFWARSRDELKQDGHELKHLDNCQLGIDAFFFF